jgi:hypothetical protein
LLGSAQFLETALRFREEPFQTDPYPKIRPICVVTHSPECCHRDRQWRHQDRIPNSDERVDLLTLLVHIDPHLTLLDGVQQRGAVLFDQSAFPVVLIPDGAQHGYMRQIAVGLIQLEEEVGCGGSRDVHVPPTNQRTRPG